MLDSRAVVICECFARDGLQSEDVFVPTDLKVRFIDAATEAGFVKIEAASYAHPKYLPRFADTEDVFALGRLAEEVLGRELHSHVVKTGLVQHRP